MNKTHLVPFGRPFVTFHKTSCSSIQLGCNLYVKGCSAQVLKLIPTNLTSIKTAQTLAGDGILNNLHIL